MTKRREPAPPSPSDPSGWLLVSLRESPWMAFAVAAVGVAAAGAISLGFFFGSYIVGVYAGVTIYAAMILLKLFASAKLVAVGVHIDPPLNVVIWAVVASLIVIMGMGVTKLGFVLFAQSPAEGNTLSTGVSDTIPEATSPKPEPQVPPPVTIEYVDFYGVRVPEALQPQAVSLIPNYLTPIEDLKPEAIRTAYERCLATPRHNSLHGVVPRKSEADEAWYYSIPADRCTVSLRAEDDVDICDILVSVIKFSHYPPYPWASSSTYMPELPIVVVPIAQSDTSEYPWEFGALYQLNDPSKHSVGNWTTPLHVSKAATAKFGVAVISYDSGIFAYTAELVVRRADGRESKVRLFDHPRICVFTRSSGLVGGITDKEFSEMQLRAWRGWSDEEAPPLSPEALPP